MNLPLVLALFAAAPAHAPHAGPPLVVVDDRGGDSALPYYQALHPQGEVPHAQPPATKAPRIAPHANVEADMLPVRSARLSPGEEPRRVIRAPGLRPLFLIGDDSRSRTWLRERLVTLREIHATGLVVNVATPEALASLRRLAPGLMLVPASGDDLAARLGVHHYPALLTATGIEP